MAASFLAAPTVEVQNIVHLPLFLTAKFFFITKELQGEVEGELQRELQGELYHYLPLICIFL